MLKWSILRVFWHIFTIFGHNGLGTIKITYNIQCHSDSRGLAPTMAPGRTGLENISRRTDHSNFLRSSACLTMSTWNCHGLSKVKKDFCASLNHDIICLTETHKWRDSDNLMICSELPKENDSWSGVALLFSSRISKLIMFSGSIGSRIVYARIRGAFCNLFVVGAYIPHKTRINPDQNTTYNQLEELLLKVGPRDCVILLGDFNSRLSRMIDRRVGRWCIHHRRDSGGDRLLEMMNKVSLTCASTYFQPCRKKNNSTFMNIEKGKPPSQIDYILISERWSTAAVDCKTLWGPSTKRARQEVGSCNGQTDFQNSSEKRSQTTQ